MTRPRIVAVGPVSILVGLAIGRIWDGRRGRRDIRRLTRDEEKKED